MCGLFLPKCMTAVSFFFSLSNLLAEINAFAKSYMLPFRLWAVLKVKPWTRSRCIWTAAIFVLQKLNSTPL
uniref:Uncharacterized protein n=1 Tax=Caenorhabditis japonica TaxID=281687 RepID=A0A8R1IBW6_CAEJA